MGTNYSLKAKIDARKAQPKLVPVRMSPFVKRLNAKQLPVKVIGGTLWNGSWTPGGEDSAA